MGRARTGVPIPNEETYGVVGRLVVGFLERSYGLDRSGGARLRWLGAVPFLQRGEERELVRLRVPPGSRFPSSRRLSRERPATLADHATISEADFRPEPFS